MNLVQFQLEKVGKHFVFKFPVFFQNQFSHREGVSTRLSKGPRTLRKGHHRLLVDIVAFNVEN